MKSRIAIGSWLLIAALVGCGDDSSSPTDTKDAGPDGGENVSGTGGKGGKGGQSGGGRGGQNASGEGGNGAGGQGGEGGSGGDGNDDVTYSIGGEASGLKGSGLVLRLNDANDLNVTKDGGFVFDKKLAKDEDYRVSVKTQPKSPVQACSVEDGEGTVGEEDIESVKIKCSDVSRSIGGTITGLGGGTIVLKNNNGDDLTVTQDGTFTFHTTLKPAAGYEVKIGTSPNGRTCSLTKAKGTLGDNNITDVTIACYENLTVAARARPGSVGVTWNNNGATSYTVWAFNAASCNLDKVAECAGALSKPNATSPFVFDGLENGKVAYFAVVSNHPDSFTLHSGASGARPNEATFDLGVNAIARGGTGTIYVGGAFTSVGPYTGPVAPIDKSTGATSRIPDFPLIPGNVTTAIPDGSGGYYVAGAFTIEVADGTDADCQNGVRCINNLAHVSSSGVVDPAWKPNPGPNTGAPVTVRTAALQGSTLYITGTFTDVGGTARASGLAAINVMTGALVTTWNPVLVEANGVLGVEAIVGTGTKVYLGGEFTSVNGTTRNGLAAVDPTTAVLDATWNPAPILGDQNSTTPGNVKALALNGTTLYVAGNFDRLGMVVQGTLAAVSAEGMGAAISTFVPPEPDDLLSISLAVSTDALYIGGSFTKFGNDDRKHLAAVNLGDGGLRSWTPEADAAVVAVAASGDTVYVTGSFLTIKSAGAADATPRKYLAAIDKSGKLTGWDPRPNAAPNALAEDPNTVYVAGGNTVTSFGGELYARLAAFNGDSLTTWHADVKDGNVQALAAVGNNTIYVGGTFTAIGADTRNGLASLSETGALNAWYPKLSGAPKAAVNALTATGDVVYAGGAFTTPGSGTRTNLVAFNVSDFAIKSGWAFLSADAPVEALALDANVLYLGGSFANVNDGSNSGIAGLAAVNVTNGEVLDTYNPNVGGGGVLALAVTADNVIAGGDFTTLGGNPHPALGKIVKSGSSTTPVVDTWNPLFAVTDIGNKPSVQALAVGVSNTLYAGGIYDLVGPTVMAPASNSHVNLVVLDYSAETIFDSGVNANSSNVSALLTSPGTGSVTNLYVGGSFRSVGNTRGGNYVSTTFNPQ